MSKSVIQVLNAMDAEWLDKNGFRSDARTILSHAQRRAVDRGMCGKISSIMALWALLRWERTTAIAIIEGCGVDVRALEAEVERTLDRLVQDCDENWRDYIDFVEINELAMAAKAESVKLKFSDIGTGELLLAMTAISNRWPLDVFKIHNIDYERLRREHFASR